MLREIVSFNYPPQYMNAKEELWIPFYIFRYEDNIHEMPEPISLLYNDCRVFDVPEGFYKYELRTDDDGLGDFCEVSEHILVNFGATVITREKLETPIYIKDYSFDCDSTAFKYNMQLGRMECVRGDAEDEPPFIVD